MDKSVQCVFLVAFLLVVCTLPATAIDPESFWIPGALLFAAFVAVVSGAILGDLLILRERKQRTRRHEAKEAEAC